MSISVNFEIVAMNKDLGTMSVRYLADGATEERFLSQSGPIIIPILPECSNMTDDQLKQHIAEWGRGIIIRQMEVLTSEQQGIYDKISTMINLKQTSEIPDEPTP